MPPLAKSASRLGNNNYAANTVSFLLIVLAVVLLYSPSLKIGYESDDFQIFAALESSEFSLLDPFPVGTGTYFRPLTHLTLLIMHPFAADQSGTLHHLANMLNHTANAILVYLLCRLISGRWQLALGLALLFAVHPSGITPVFRITDRSTLLLTFFYIAALYCFIRFLIGGRSLWLFLAGAAVIGSLLSKEAGVTVAAALGIILLVYRFWLIIAGPTPAKNTRKALFALAIYSLLSAAYLIYLYLAIYRNFDHHISTASSLRVTQQVGAFVAVLLFPNNETLLRALYDKFPFYFMAAGLVLLFLLLTIFILIYKRTGRRQLILVLLLVLLVLLPLLPQIFFAGVNSRQLNLSLALICIAIAIWCTAVQRSTIRCTYLLLPIIVYAALLSYHHGSVRTANWQAYQRACTSFRTIMADAPDDPGIVVFAIPHSYHSAPFMSNDGKSALFHCLYGRFGQFSRFRYFSPLYTYFETPQQEIVSIEQPLPGVYSLSLLSSDAYFLSEPPQSYRGETPGSSLSFESKDSLGHGRSEGLVIEITEPEGFDEIYFLVFDGLDFQILSIGL